MSTETVNVLKQEQNKIPSPFLKLTKEQQKIENAFNNNLAAVLGLLDGNSFSPIKTIPRKEMPRIMEEFFKEEVKKKENDVKVALKELFSSKVDFDRTVNEETRKFQAAIITKKKEFNEKTLSVIKLIGSIDQIREEFMKSLNITPVEDDSDLPDGESSKKE